MRGTTGENVVTIDRDAQRRHAEALVGRPVQFFDQRGESGQVFLVLRATVDGMLEIEGLAGLFAPHLFCVVDPELFTAAPASRHDHEE
jgi:hypothetical protein